MKAAYADSSFLLRLLVPGSAAERAVAAHRKLGAPHLHFTALHELEVPNAIRLRTFVALSNNPPRMRVRIQREQADALRRLELSLRLGRFLRLRVQWEDACAEAAELSERYAARMGVRSFDLLHVQLAVLSPSNDFLTCDARQAPLARAAGLKVTLLEP